MFALGITASKSSGPERRSALAAVVHEPPAVRRNRRLFEEEAEAGLGKMRHLLRRPASKHEPIEEIDLEEIAIEPEDEQPP